MWGEVSLMLLIAAFQSSDICFYWFLPSFWKPVSAGLLRIPNTFRKLHPPQNHCIWESLHPPLKELVWIEENNCQQLLSLHYQSLRNWTFRTALKGFLCCSVVKWAESLSHKGRGCSNSRAFRFSRALHSAVTQLHRKELLNCSNDPAMVSAI